MSIAPFKKALSEYVDDIEKSIDVATNDLSQAWGKDPELGDVLWRIANNIIVDLVQSNKIESLPQLYWHMALFAYKNNKKDYLNIMDEIRKIKLRQHKSMNGEKLEILACGDSCDACKKNNRKIITFSEATEEVPIPNKECSFKLQKKSEYGWCRCTYLPVLD